jgi:bacterioferritin-associated ferredoxin
MAVDRCICRKITFAEALAGAVARGCRTVAELQRHVDIGTNCGLCIPYMQRSLLTGEVDLPVMNEREAEAMLACSGLAPAEDDA